MGTPMKMSSTESPRVDRRRRERVAGETEAWIFPPTARMFTHGPAEDEGWEVRVYDVSRFGVGFTSMQELGIGTVHRLRIGRGPLHRARLVRVVVCREGDNGAFAVGGEFLDSGHRPMAKAG